MSDDGRTRAATSKTHGRAAMPHIRRGIVNLEGVKCLLSCASSHYVKFAIENRPRRVIPRRWQGASSDPGIGRRIVDIQLSTFIPFPVVTAHKVEFSIDNTGRTVIMRK